MSDNKTPQYIEGIGWRHETEHRQTRRHRTHDYSGIGTYEVTLVVAGRMSVFGHLDGVPILIGKTTNAGAATPVSPSPAPNASSAPNASPAQNIAPMRNVSPFRHPTTTTLAQQAWLVASPLGQRILTQEIAKIHAIYPMAEVWQQSLMPDHIHLIIRFSAPLPPKVSLGTIIRGFKTGCSRAYWDTLPPGVEQHVLFESGYNDHILMRDGQLANWKRYLAENPFRAWIRQQRPDLLQRALCMVIAGVRYGAFGNFSLLRHPEKHQVFFHRNTDGIRTEDTPYWKQEHDRLINYAQTGDVLVTPGISECEKRIKNEAIEDGYRLIHIQKDPISRLWKPERSRFLACSAGTLLILAPWQEDILENTDYGIFHHLNDLAATICSLSTDAEARIIGTNL